MYRLTTVEKLLELILPIVCHVRIQLQISIIDCMPGMHGEVDGTGVIYGAACAIYGDPL